MRNTECYVQINGLCSFQKVRFNDPICIIFMCLTISTENVHKINNETNNIQNLIPNMLLKYIR